MRKKIFTCMLICVMFLRSLALPAWADGGAEIVFQPQNPTYNVGAAMSLVMMILILISLTIMNKFSDEEGGMVP